MAFTAHALALTGALCSAAATIAFRQGLRHSNTHTGFWINLVVGFICVWVATLLTVPASAMHAKALPFFIGSGLLGTVAGRFFRFKGIEKVGAPVSAAIKNLNPSISTGLAILIRG
jgi:drug/metabolite transporter (DMT)-like permease